MSSRSGENIPALSYTSRQSQSHSIHSKTLTPLADSSEDEPSPHSSIYEAPLASDSESEEARSLSRKKGSNFVTVAARDVRVGSASEDEEARQSHDSSRGEDVDDGVGSRVNTHAESRTNFRPSLGLGTIVEQKNDSGLREEESALPRLDRQSSSESSEDNDGDESSLLPRARRKKARTESLRSDYFEYYNDEEVYDYASPSQPLYQSVSALNNAGEIILFYLSGLSCCQYTDYLLTNNIDSPLSPASPLPGGTPPISASFFNRNYSPSSPIHTPLQGPTFRPPTSGYRSYGTLANHPFHTAPMARSDRGEGSSRRDGSSGFPTTGVSTPDSLRSGGRRSRAGSVGHANSTGGLIEKLKYLFFCCLGRREVE